MSRLSNVIRMLNGDRYIHPLNESKYETTIGWNPDYGTERHDFQQVYGPTPSGELEYTRQVHPAREPVKVARTIKAPILAKLMKAVTR